MVCDVQEHLPVHHRGYDQGQEQEYGSEEGPGQEQAQAQNAEQR